MGQQFAKKQQILAERGSPSSLRGKSKDTYIHTIKRS